MTVVVCGSTSDFVATGLRIENCTASDEAAVIVGSNSKVVFNNTFFKDNKSGAICIDQGANATFIETSFDGNEAINGGAIYADNYSHVELVNSVFKGRITNVKDNNTILLMCTTS